jgi:hypothetical protein
VPDRRETEGAAGFGRPSRENKSRQDIDQAELASASPFGEIVALLQEFGGGALCGLILLYRTLTMPVESRGVRLDQAEVKA